MIIGCHTYWQDEKSTTIGYTTTASQASSQCPNFFNETSFAILNFQAPAVNLNNQNNNNHNNNNNNMNNMNNDNNEDENNLNLNHIGEERKRRYSGTVLLRLDDRTQPFCTITLKNTREVAGFNELAEAMLRLDMIQAVKDVR